MSGIFMKFSSPSLSSGACMMYSELPAILRTSPSGCASQRWSSFTASFLRFAACSACER